MLETQRCYGGLERLNARNAAVLRTAQKAKH